MKRITHARNGDWSALDAYLRDVSQIPALSEEEVQALGKKANAGGAEALEAREQLVKSHLRLVVKIAHQYAGFGLPLADLIAEGNLGLMRATELYDPKFGTRFLTYASVWVKQRIHRAITSQAKVVRIPVWRSQRLRKLARIQEELSSQLGRTASEEDLAERLGISVEGVTDLQGDRIEVVSLDAPAPGEDETHSVGELLRDNGSEHPAHTLSVEELHEEMVACLADLDDRELQVISHKFGFKVEAPLSFRELGRRMGVSHEWVRRIAELAIVKMRRAFADSAQWSSEERQKRQKSVLARFEVLRRKLAPAAVK